MTDHNKKPYVSALEKIYASDPETLKQSIQEFVQNPVDLEHEIQHISFLTDNSTDLKKLIFIIEVLHKSIKKHIDYKMYYKHVLRILEIMNKPRHTVFVLRVVRVLSQSRFYTPLAFYMLRILRQLTTMTKTISIGRNIGYDNVCLSEDESKSEELVFFGVGEVRTLLMRHLALFSNNIGFPEIACLVVAELRKIEYGKLIVNMISKIEKQREYVVAERRKMKIDMLDMDSVVKFEKNVARMETD